MKREHFFRGLLLVSLAGGVLACNLVSGVSQQVNGTRETAAALATDLGEGGNLMATGQALATELGSRGLVETAQAFVTEDSLGLMATAQAFATEDAPMLMETAQAYMTEQGPGLMETAQAFATVGVPSLMETAQAALPGDMELPTASANNAPADIPIMPAAEVSLATEQLVTYTVAQPLDAVVAYYKTQLVSQGWTLDDQGVVQTQMMWILPFTKNPRQATVTLTAGGTDTTLVVIAITS